MKEINLLKKYPITKRNLDEALLDRTDDVREIARKFNKDFLMEKENMDMEDIITIQDIGEVVKIFKITIN